MSSEDLSYYCKKFATLNVNKHNKRGTAPHKPILLLSVIELIEQGQITENRIYLNAELIATFHKYWDYLGSDLHRSSIHNPFYHLTGDQFWHLKGTFNLDPIKNLRSPSLKVLKEIIAYAYFDEELFRLLKTPESRSQLLKVLIDTWFTNKQSEIYDLFEIDAFKKQQDRLKETGGKIYSTEELDEEVNIVRDAAFRKVITSIYDYRCAFCGLRIIDSKFQNIVDASHIKPFSEFRDDRITNGLSLCKNHHWALDKGWFGIDNNYKIIVSKAIEDISPNNRSLKYFEGESIILPDNQSHFPSVEALSWHIQNTFQKEIA